MKQQNKKLGYPTPSKFKWNPDLQPATCSLRRLTFNPELALTVPFKQTGFDYSAWALDPIDL